eukprot:scaffold32581_cov63-Phaeocystis_antarctica.AAC.2
MQLAVDERRFVGVDGALEGEEGERRVARRLEQGDGAARLVAQPRLLLVAQGLLRLHELDELRAQVLEHARRLHCGLLLEVLLHLALEDLRLAPQSQLRALPRRRRRRLVARRLRDGALHHQDVLLVARHVDEEAAHRQRGAARCRRRAAATRWLAVGQRDRVLPRLEVGGGELGPRDRAVCVAHVRLLGGAKPDLRARPGVEQLEGDGAELRRCLAVELKLELLVPRGRALGECEVLLGQAALTLEARPLDLAPRAVDGAHHDIRLELGGRAAVDRLGRRQLLRAADAQHELPRAKQLLLDRL